MQPWRWFIAAGSACALVASCATVASASRTVPQAEPSATHGPHRLDVDLAVALKDHAVDSSQYWAGYAAVADGGVQLDSVQAYFTVPYVNCAPGGSTSKQLVGLDGLNDSTFEGAGIITSCTGTTANYSAFYEMEPSSAWDSGHPTLFSGTINPGDAIHAWVSFTNASYSLNVTDVSTKATMQTTQPCPGSSSCLNQSAEVVTSSYENIPGFPNGVNPFGMVNYTEAKVTSLTGATGTLASKPGYWSSTKISMKINGDTLAVPSPLEGDEGFNVTCTQDICH